MSVHVVARKGEEATETDVPVLPVTNVAFERHFGVGFLKARRDSYVEHDCWLAWDAELRAGRAGGSFEEFVRSLAPMRSAVVAYIDGEVLEVPVTAETFIAFERAHGTNAGNAVGEGLIEPMYWIAKHAVHASGKRVVAADVLDWIETVADVTVTAPTWAEQLPDVKRTPEGGVDLTDRRVRVVRFEDRPNPFVTRPTPARSPDSP